MKQFKVYAGLDENNMSEVLHSSLKNDTVPETFSVKYINRAGICFPTRYVKIVPLSAHSASFHTSIWHVSMTGITDEAHIQRTRVKFEEYRESAVLLHILKHLRQRRLLTPYKAILSTTSIRLEHPLITTLYTVLVIQGNYSETLALLPKMTHAGLFDSYLHSCQPHANWRRLTGTEDADGDIPCKRSGHAMCIDQGKLIIYLFGGWDGQKSLDDFWMYDIQEERWKVLSRSTSLEKNGPEPRTCHKMVFDPKTGCIYLLGRLGDKMGTVDEARTNGVAEENVPTPYCSEFHRYHTRGLDAGNWDLLSFDTASSGGPPLIFDHQMAIDGDAQILYVFGGQVVDGDDNNCKYSGLYSYNVRTSKWKMLQPNETSASSSQVIIQPRFGHSMVLDAALHTLFIFAGQRDGKYLADMFAFDVLTNTATELYSNFTTTGGPDACFTQRAVLDRGLKEIYVFNGLIRAQATGSSTFLCSDRPNWVYRYGTRPGKWTKILPEIPDTNPEEGTSGTSEEPQPRYAHQVVYEESTKTFFLYGGNAGQGNGGMEKVPPPEEETENGEGEQPGEREESKTQPKEIRLDDFWSMTLNRPAPTEIIRRATYRIRQQQFREMCEDSPPIKALSFLQNEVSSTVDHNNAEESAVFRSLLSHLLMPSITPASVPSRHPSTNSASGGRESGPQNCDTRPKKRSRQSTPEEAWTSKLDEDEVAAEGASSSDSETSSPLASHSLLTFEEDPEERGIRGSGTASLSAERFQQRSEVFESLLEFVGQDAKQPSGSMLDMMNGIEDP